MLMHTEQVATLPVVFFGADHGGFALKEELKQRLAATMLCTVVDCGAENLDPQDDYPQFAFAVAERILEARAADKIAFGVLVCRSSGGMTIAANKVPGIRAVSANTVAEAEHARRDNDAHIISISGDWSSAEESFETVTAFLHTVFSGEERHARRIAQIARYEETR